MNGSSKMVPFEPQHILDMELDLSEVRHVLELRTPEEAAHVLDEASEQAGTLICDEFLVCSTGFRTLWPGVAECWTMPSIYVRLYAMRYARAIRRYIDQVIDTFGYHRVQTACIDDQFHWDWMEFLGFESEGRLRKYTSDGVHFRMFSRV